MWCQIFTTCESTAWFLQVWCQNQQQAPQGGTAECFSSLDLKILSSRESSSELTMSVVSIHAFLTLFHLNQEVLLRGVYQRGTSSTNPLLSQPDLPSLSAALLH